jgi:hypothetical protein
MGTDWDNPLGALRWHWGEAYTICHPEPDMWLAERRDNHETLRSDTPMGLRDAIIEDYFSRPVSRQAAPPAARPEADVQEKPSLRPCT